ncbi:MAG: hypothetical protein ACC742_07730 [Thermoanaerobaculales bacterium]
MKTPLAVAIESGQYDLALLLLCNGYRADLEPLSVLNTVLECKAWDYLELLLAWGADATQADPDSVLGTYEVAIMERFWDLGNDLTRNRCLAHYLASTTSNKPAYGWARRHKEDPRVAYALALALGDAVDEDRVKAVSLLIWAGADSHRKVQSLRWRSDDDDDPDDDRDTAIERAVHMGRGGLLRHLKLDPAVDDFEEMYAWVCDPDTLEHLVDLRPPGDWSKAIVRNASRMSWWYGGRWGSRACLEHIFEHHWGRLSTLEHHECQDFRRTLLKMESDSDLSWLLQKLAKPHHCDEAIFAELTRTPAMKRRMGSLQLTKLLPQKTSKRSAKRSPQRKHVDLQDLPQESQEEKWLSNLDPDARAAVLRGLISREQLYEEVWAEPVTKVAGRYGVSDVAVAKWCKKLNVPRPGRGYWARKNAGRRVRQMPLPEAKEGQQKYFSRPKSEKRSPAPSAKILGLELFEKPIPVPEVLDPEYLLVTETRRVLEGAESDEHGILRPRGVEVLDIGVCEASMKRALRIMNALIRALEGAGFAVEIDAILDSAGRPSGYTTSAVIHDERIAFSMTEKTQRKERAPTDEERAEMRRSPWRRGPFYAHSPSGVFSLQIERGWHRERHRRTWSDGKPRRLEGCLYSVVRSLLISADARKRRRLEAEG